MTEQDAEAFHEATHIAHAARIAHEVNRAYCIAIGDGSQPAWEDAPRWQRDSAINGVIAIDADPYMTPEDSHQNWMAQKQAEGWKWGPVKDPAAKEHPCMKPYADLPPEQRIKDHLFIAAVNAALT